jgi:hypothetical protein
MPIIMFDQDLRDAADALTAAIGKIAALRDRLHNHACSADTVPGDRAVTRLAHASVVRAEALARQAREGILV